MNEKKNIDKLFKEHFKNFDVTPKDHVWEHIEERLHEDKRKKRRVIPIWWKVAGVAAGLVLLFTVANQFFNPSEKDNISNDVVVDESKTNENLKSQDNNNTNTIEQKQDPSEFILDNNSSEQTEQIANTNTKSSVEDDKDASINKNKSNTLSSEQKNNSTIASENSNRLKIKEESQNSNTTNSNENFKKILEEKKAQIQESSTKDAVVESSNASNKTNNNTQDLIKDKSELDKIIESTKSDNNTAVADVNTKEKEISDSENNSKEDPQNKEKEDTTNAIENAIAEVEDTDEKEEEEEELNRWSVSPNVAPVYFSSLGEGSSIDDQFIGNSKESDINMSYGIAGSYAINKKLKIRAGINRVDLGYTTNDVLIFENSNENLFARDNNQIPNVDSSESVGRYSIYSSDSFNFENAPATLLTKETGSLDQQLGFIEIPIEIEYTLVEKKLGVNLIGGFSTFFLNQNDIYAVFNNGERARIGDASNVRDMSYSANFGIGLDYNFSNQWQFNLDPTFKYQINTFNNTSGDFQPFFIGVYTGLSFKF